MSRTKLYFGNCISGYTWIICIVSEDIIKSDHLQACIIFQQSIQIKLRWDYETPFFLYYKTSPSGISGDFSVPLFGNNHRKLLHGGRTLDSFTVSMHNPNGRHCLPLGLCMETVSGLLKTVGIPTSHFSQQWTATNPGFIAYLGTPQSKCKAANNVCPCLMPYW